MKLMKKSLCIFLAWSLFVLSFPVTVQAQDKMAVAVLDLEGRGISALEAATLTDRLRSEMVALGAFTVVERGQMEMILEEQGFQQTGCTSAECAVEVGKMLGVQAMVTGSIGKLGSMYTVDVRMFDVGTGQIGRISKRDVKGEVEELLGTLKKVTRDLAGLPDEEEAAPVAEETAEPKKKGGKGFFWLLLLAAAGGGGYYAYSEGMLDDLLGIGPDELGLPPEPPTAPGSN
ncbi:MAG: CsgG/HfaB family protein [Candidatus Marinimicrobia bacterium]|jgi:TolB-like protein|nr:CsgG/HfaB family protein [Candidatus Neomarinimicrobiota bacterium]MDP6966748.1 CsgG/HfaB family protein [Candidatus Neomarinimicrobiota bacterium]|tara:strand:+ start:3157 stop:3849 length:693 start_codon:yes stop_codon:yes gene_type:complete